MKSLNDFIAERLGPMSSSEWCDTHEEELRDAIHKYIIIMAERGSQNNLRAQNESSKRLKSILPPKVDVTSVIDHIGSMSLQKYAGNKSEQKKTADNLFNELKNGDYDID